MFPSLNAVQCFYCLLDLIEWSTVLFLKVILPRETRIFPPPVKTFDSLVWGFLEIDKCILHISYYYFKPKFQVFTRVYNVLFFGFTNQNFVCIPCIFHPCSMPSQLEHSQSALSNYIWYKIRVKQFSHTLCYFLCSK